MSKARAAEIWARLERFLIEHCGLPDGRMLERDRAELIRKIGVEFSGSRELGLPAPPVKKPVAKELKFLTKSGATSRRIQGDCGATINDQVLANMLERSCSRRVGYDGDDEVTYAGSR